MCFEGMGKVSGITLTLIVTTVLNVSLIRLQSKRRREG